MDLHRNTITAEEQERFDELMKRTYKKVYNMAYRLSGNASDAEDLTQDTFIRALRAFDTYDGGKPFENWVFRILSRLFLDLLRYRKRRVVTVSYDAPIPQENDDTLFFEKADEHNSPERILLSESLSESMEHAIMSLTPEQRLIVVMADLEGVPYKDIAEMVDAPIGTIRSRLHRIHKQLRKRLDEWEQKNKSQKLSLCKAS